MPAALSYLNSIGIDPEEAVVLIVATHWHDDHIRGLATVVESCPSALFSCPVAFRKNEFSAAVSRYNRHPNISLGSGVEELWKIYHLLQDRRRRPKLASANMRVFSLPGTETGHGHEVQFWALSPSDHQVDKFLVEIANCMPQVQETKYRAVAQKPNHVSLVSHIEIGKTTILLGSDMEVDTDDSYGWSAIINNRDPLLSKAGIYKMAHHGSHTGHHDGIWSELLLDAPFALITPWNKSGGLPTTADIERISTLTHNGYITSTIRQITSKIRRDPAVEKTIQELLGSKLRRAELPFGTIRLRTMDSDHNEWKVELSDSASSIDQLAKSLRKTH